MVIERFSVSITMPSFSHDPTQKTLFGGCNCIAIVPDDDFVHGSFGKPVTDPTLPTPTVRSDSSSLYTSRIPPTVRSSGLEDGDDNGNANGRNDGIRFSRRNHKGEVC